jgi:hypothetical protein
MTIWHKKWAWLVVLLLLFIIVVAALWPVEQAAIAVVTLQPMAGSMKAGQQFEEKVVLRSNKPANAVDITVKYPADQLEVITTVTKQSRFDMVLFPPKVDATKGTIRFVQASAVPFSGQGDEGLIGTIKFKAKQAVEPIITVSGKVVANDAKGTDLAVVPVSKALWRVIVGR